jgi:hypothetical protein
MPKSHLPKGFRYTWGLRKLKQPENPDEPWDFHGELIKTNDDIEVLMESRTEDTIITRELIPDQPKNPSLSPEQLFLRERKKLINKLQAERLPVAEHMKRYGGMFEKTLANCIGFADDDNLIKIYNAWTDLWNMHRDTSAQEEISYVVGKENRQG